MLLLRSYAGSKLHGLSSPTSDTDIFEIYSSASDFGTFGKTEIQVKKGDLDLTQMTLGAFAIHSMLGSHQSLDAMFSGKVEVDLITAYRAGYRADYSSVRRLTGTIFDLLEKRDAKKYRHAIRIAINAEELARTGRYQPTLTEEQVDFVKQTAYEDYASVLAGIVKAFPSIRFRTRIFQGIPSNLVEAIKRLYR